jgi:hypothetical protein
MRLVHVYRHSNTQRNQAECESKLKQPSLKEDIEVAIDTAVSNPVLHFELAVYSAKEFSKDLVSFGLEEQAPLVNFLDAEVLINWNFN